MVNLKKKKNQGKKRLKFYDFIFVRKFFSIISEFGPNCQLIMSERNCKYQPTNSTYTAFADYEPFFATHM